MAIIGSVPEIIEVKKCFEQMRQEGLIVNWELPYENLLTRISAAIFFFTPNNSVKQEDIMNRLKQYEKFVCRGNTEKKLSKLEYRIEIEN